MKARVILDKNTALFKTDPPPKFCDSSDLHTRRGFEDMDYDRWIFLARHLLSHLPKETKHKKLLEIGCGAGYFSFEAKRQGFIVKAIDTSVLAVKYAVNVFNINAKCISLFDFKTKDKFDVIIINHVLEHITEIDKFLKKVKELASKDGYILLASPRYDNLMRVIFGDKWYGLVPSEHVWQFTPTTLENYLKKQGFKIIKIFPASLDYNPSNPIKNLVFRILTTFAEFIDKGDQLVFLLKKS